MHIVWTSVHWDFTFADGTERLHSCGAGGSQLHVCGRSSAMQPQCSFDVPVSSLLTAEGASDSPSAQLHRGRAAMAQATNFGKSSEKKHWIDHYHSSNTSWNETYLYIYCGMLLDQMIKLVCYTPYLVVPNNCLIIWFNNIPQEM